MSVRIRNILVYSWLDKLKFTFNLFYKEEFGNINKRTAYHEPCTADEGSFIIQRENSILILIRSSRKELNIRLFKNYKFNREDELIST